MRQEVKYITILLVLVVILHACVVNKKISLAPSGLRREQTISIESGDLKAVFVDNTAFGTTHLAGYNGIASLQHKKEDSTLFVPQYAGFNLEHIFGGDTLQQLFEPRRHPMSLFRKSDTEVILYQSSTPLSQVESVTEFKIVPPHYIDVTFRLVLQSDTFFKHGYAGFFWASYIPRPDDPKIYFMGSEGEHTSTSWIAAYSQEHGISSTHRNIKDTLELYFDQEFNARLANHYSGYRFTEPFYYGRFREMCFAYLFDTTSLIRFSQSPTGGGGMNPAWDFQFIIPDPKPNKIYSFRTRLVYKPFLSSEDVRNEYIQWKR